MYSPVNCRSSSACRTPDSQNCALAIVSLVVIRPSNVPCDRPSATFGKGVVFGTAPMNRVRHAWPGPPLLRIFRPLRSA